MIEGGCFCGSVRHSADGGASNAIPPRSAIAVRRALWVVVAALGLDGACLLPMPCPTPRSGQVTSLDGRPLAGAQVGVETWALSMPGAFKESLVHTSVTQTGADGRWSVAGRATLRFVLPVPEMPVVSDELTVQPMGMTPVRFSLGFPHDAREDAEDHAPFRVTWDGPRPWSVLTLPAFGVTAGGGQKGAVHVGGMLLAGRGAIGAGVRGEIAAGINAASAAAGLVVPFSATAPFLGIELSGRYMRPWSSEGGRRAEWGPELGLDIDSWRLTFTALGPSATAPFDRRRVVVGFGWGYF